ncbi:hypothetical protein, partial [Ideonella sp.]|uniref:hypothetical protein n=1 Tax=Ideonella sp. TaxID=1929293 RepID=UPI003BB6D9E8
MINSTRPPWLCTGTLLALLSPGGCLSEGAGVAAHAASGPIGAAAPVAGAAAAPALLLARDW